MQLTGLLETTVTDATEYSTTEASELAPVGTDALFLYNSENSSTSGKVSILMRSAGGGGGASARITLKNERSGSGGLGFFFRDNGHTGEQQEKMYLSSDGNLTVDGTASATQYNRGAAEMGTAIIHDHQLAQTTYSLANSNTTWVNSGLTKTVTPQSAKSYFWVEAYHNEHINPNTPNHGGGMRILGDSTEIARGGEFEFQVGSWASSADYRYNGNSKTWGSWYNPQTASAIVFKAQVVAPNNTGSNTGNFYYWHWGSNYIANHTGPRLRIVEFT
jgi:hypothetical protein